MEFTISPEHAAFRASVRQWLADNVPSQPRPPITQSGREQSQYMRAWQRQLFDGGWAGISWPRQYGGRGLTLIEQVIWYEEYAKAGAPEGSCLFVGLQHAGPTLILKASPEQRAFHLPRLLKGETLWCQGFSEPGAGSDLAGIACRAQLDGDHLVVNGSKIWTSYAQIADYQELVVRTEPGSTRHQGLSWVICDMKTPGITVRPIKSLDGEYHNCEVFYDNVRLPLSNVVGRLGDGWNTAMATLSFERGTAFMESQLRLSFIVEKIIALARNTLDRSGRPMIEDGHVAARLGRLRGQSAALKAMTYMGASRAIRTDVPGPESTYIALALAEQRQAAYRLAMELLGPYGLEQADEIETDQIVHRYLASFSASIGGGTSEIRRNIIGERVLGLPRHS